MEGLEAFWVVNQEAFVQMSLMQQNTLKMEHKNGPGDCRGLFEDCTQSF
ncbi:MAG: hypothetical protein HW380_2600 [Magnetococcales bacterium]|nr:hypothetical protein [Magnetococcales bacterium]